MLSLIHIRIFALVRGLFIVIPRLVAEITQERSNNA